MVEQVYELNPTTLETGDLELGSIFFVGTATTLIRFGGFTLLTDPNFLHAGDHAHLGYGMTSKRLTNPAIDVDQLPPLDLCVLSHMHGDHWDHIAAARLPKTLPIVSTRQAVSRLRKQGFKASQALKTWQHLTFKKGDHWLRITAMPGHHGPGPVNALLPSVMGSLLEYGTGVEPPRFRLYITGDTLVYDEINEIPRRFPDIDLALLHLGGTRVLGLMVTMDARQGIRMLNIVRPKQAIPIHYNDYTVFKSPLTDFQYAVEIEKPETEVHYLHQGETFEFRVPLKGDS